MKIRDLVQHVQQERGRTGAIQRDRGSWLYLLIHHPVLLDMLGGPAGRIFSFPILSINNVAAHRMALWGLAGTQSDNTRARRVRSTPTYTARAQRSSVEGPPNARRARSPAAPVPRCVRAEPRRGAMRMACGGPIAEDPGACPARPARGGRTGAIQRDRRILNVWIPTTIDHPPLYLLTRPPVLLDVLDGPVGEYVIGAQLRTTSCPRVATTLGATGNMRRTGRASEVSSRLYGKRPGTVRPVDVGASRRRRWCRWALLRCTPRDSARCRFVGSSALGRGSLVADRLAVSW